MSLAPAVTKDGFAFAGDFYAEASDRNRHRRATLAELKDLFKSGEDKARPWHWFEAQLVHYGLPPSKTKAVARMRLYDAVNEAKGVKLSVPTHIQKLESDLKKQWTKNERDAKKAMKAPATASSAAPAKGAKRKAESSNVDLTVNVGGINVTVSASSSSSQTNAKKAKTTKAATTKPTASATSATKPKASASKSKPKETAPKKATPKKTAPKAATPKKTGQKQAGTSSGAPARTKQTARRGGISQGPSRGGSTPRPASPAAPRNSRLARRSGAFAATGRLHAPPQPVNNYNHDDGDFGYDEPPPPYSEYGGNISDDNDDDDDHNDYHDHDDKSLGPLGLLNGRYRIVSNEVLDQWWSHYDEDDFSLVLTLSGRELWGKFDIGVISGIIRFSERPWESSNDTVYFTWRGEEDQGPIIYGDNHDGWIKFLGDGRIEGVFDYMGLDFHGERLQNQGTRSEVEASAMRSEWHGYTEDEYDRSNQSRW